MNNTTKTLLKCEICGRECYNYLSLSTHIHRTHKLTSKEYYDKFCKSDEDGVCKLCKKPTKFVSIGDGYRTYCGPSCARSAPEIVEKARQTLIRHYGSTDNFYAERDISIKQTKLKKYGDACYHNIKKMKQTNLEKYGVDYAVAAESVRKKSIDTLQTRYGVSVPAKNEKILEKIRQTNLEKYGADWVTETNLVKDGTIKKYGVENVFQAKEIKEKIKDTMQSAYGVEHYSQTLQYHNKKIKKYKYDTETFDSMPELAFWIYCINNSIQLKRNTEIKFEYLFNHKKHYYIPDFILDGVCIELKGDHFFKEDGTMCNPFDHSQDELYEAKHQCGLNNGVKFITSAEYNKYIKFCINLFNSDTWYKQFYFGENTDEN